MGGQRGTGPPPPFFVSMESKGVTGGVFVSMDSKELSKKEFVNRVPRRRSESASGEHKK